MAKIRAINDNQEIEIDYLEQDKEYKEKFKISDRLTDIEQTIELCDIVLLLDDPDCIYRGGLTFPMKIDLKNNSI